MQGTIVAKAANSLFKVICGWCSVDQLEPLKPMFQQRKFTSSTIVLWENPPLVIEVGDRRTFLSLPLLTVSHGKNKYYAKINYQFAFLKRSEKDNNPIRRVSLNHKQTSAQIS